MNTNTFHLAGSVDQYASGELKQQVLPLPEGHGNVTLDFQDVEHFHAGATQAVIAFRCALQEHDRKLFIASASEAAMRRFRFAQLSKPFDFIEA